MHKRTPTPGGADVSRSLEVVVVEGVDLPVRSGGEEARTRLYVEATFQGQSLKTDVKGGANPIWNQRLVFTMAAPNNDWSQEALMNLSAQVQARTRTRTPAPTLRRRRSDADPKP